MPCVMLIRIAESYVLVGFLAAQRYNFSVLPLNFGKGSARKRQVEHIVPTGLEGWQRK